MQTMPTVRIMTPMMAAIATTAAINTSITTNTTHSHTVTQCMLRSTPAAGRRFVHILRQV